MIALECSPGPIKISACRALLELLPMSKVQVPREHMETVLIALCSFMQEVRDIVVAVTFVEEVS